MKLSEIGVTEKKEKQFNSKEISSVEDLIRYIPSRYNDFTRETGIRQEGLSCIIVRCDNVRFVNGKLPFIAADCYTKNQELIRISWFHQDYIYTKLRSFIGFDIYLCGRIIPDTYHGNGYACSNPPVFSSDIKGSMKLQPVYPKIRGMSEDYLSLKIDQALQDYKIKEFTPEVLRNRYRVPEINEAYRMLHHPASIQEVQAGTYRLDFDQILYFALKTEQNASILSQTSPYLIKDTPICSKLVRTLPYTLTKGQTESIQHMLLKAKQGKRISTLIQGDVGCGKSIVAFLMAAAFAESNYQSAVMAPTQVLARQHYEELSRLLDGSGITCALYEGTKMKAAEKRNMLAAIKNGDISIVVGTHALLDPKIEYNALALTIVDEEHKFGVMQKEALIGKASEGVHSITMSATPIPRSLSQVIYGETTDICTIKDMPPGRQKVKSCVTGNRAATYGFIKQELDKGHQIYVVCPAIDKNENRENIKSVEEVYSEYSAVFGNYGVKALTGRNKKDETAEILAAFNKGEIKILISTTVVEVGVNVPNATVMVIENAENFGLAQLHQLRGRVGRGNDQGYCIFFSEKEDNERLNIISSTTDGFIIAEKDMEIRGTGEFIGTRQSGEDRYVKIIMSSNLNEKVCDQLKKDARAVLDSGICTEFLEEQTKRAESL